LALRVEAASGVAVPVPRAADAPAVLEGPHLQTELQHAVELVQPSEPHTDDDHVVLVDLRALRGPRLVVGDGHAPPPEIQSATRKVPGGRHPVNDYVDAITAWRPGSGPRRTPGSRPGRRAAA